MVLKGVKKTKLTITMKNNKHLYTYIATTILITGITPLAEAAVLTGTGDHLPIPTLPHGTPVDLLYPTNTAVAGGFTGNWSHPANAAWHGTFTVTGNIPSPSNTGSASWDFTSLSSTYLPVGSIFALSDLDDGNSSIIEFQAFDAAGGVLTHWLDEPFATVGTGTGAGGSLLSTNMPGWEWDAVNSKYIFDGGTTGGNPAIAVYMNSNQAISSLNTHKSGTSNNYGIAAPTVPEPSSTLLFGLGGLGLILRRKRIS